MESSGVIVVLSYPDTIVRPAHSEFSSKIWPFFGVGGKNGVQAGHAALLLIEKKTGKVDYFDFGRYITSYGYGRVRSKEVDVELEVPLEAKFKNDELLNINELLLWLDKNPEKTHGEGRLVASINNDIDYEKATSFIDNLINKKEIAYGVLIKEGSNCARFVTDTLINSCVNKKVRTRLKASNLFTPSPIGNVIKGTTKEEIFMVYNQKISRYENRSIVKEYCDCFFKKIDIEINKIGTELPNKEVFELNNATWLGGIGSGAWFKIEDDNNGVYQIARYTANGVNDFKGKFQLKSKGFDLKKEYRFTHPTNCKEAFVIQDEKEFLFSRVS